MPETQKKSYSDTVHLPKTDFPMKGDLPKREPERLKFWEEQGIYAKMLERAQGRPSFVLHDGPPYANGNTHIGHALNKTLKDMVVKSQALMGRRAPYVPGWDCHGLPIEHALLKEMKMSKRGVKDINAFRKQARDFAGRFIDIQRDEFRRLGVLGEWDKPYKTMSNEYEAAILNAFRRLYAKGYIYRGLKAVTWCVTCETALAEAEVEYKEKASPSVYVALPVVRSSIKELHKAKVLVWTTTPWTLPANMAVAFHPDLSYVLVEVRSSVILMAEARRAAVLKALGASSGEARGSWTGKQLVDSGIVCETPFSYAGGFKHKESRGVLADYVTAEDGTGVVHTAPGHGVDDFNTGKKYGLEIFCPVDGAGHFTAEAGPFAGKKLFDEANETVIEALEKSGRLLAGAKIQHSYPHCWRCKNPIAFRATEQWFLNVNHEGLRDKLLNAIGQVRWIPEAGQGRISAMVQNRPDWCLSRQRLWGTPIPMLRCAYCSPKEYLDDDGVLAIIEEKVRKEGSDFWFKNLAQPVSPGKMQEGVLTGDVLLDGCHWDFLPKDTHCKKCKRNDFFRETDILDVWVDSGASWLGVLKERGLDYPCDLYLEGSDQHRGWFQSSLVISAALEGKAPYKTVLTHGFVLDDKGRAMHKSLGNVVSPQQVIDKLGADVLRLWVALADYSDDVRLSDKLLEVPTEGYRKLRNTFRYLLGNVSDFDPNKNGIAYDSMPDLERYILKRLLDTEIAVKKAYDEFEFRKAATMLVDFCNLELSSFYLDARKDVLYTYKEDDPLRRAAQAVMWECLVHLVCLAAPILSFTCEEVWQELRKHSSSLPESVFLYNLSIPVDVWDQAKIHMNLWECILAVRVKTLKALEEKRAKGIIGSSLQARAILKAGGAMYDERLAKLTKENWAELLIVSSVELHKTGTVSGDVEVEIEKAAGSKCPRCWRYVAPPGKEAELCERCARQLAA